MSLQSNVRYAICRLSDGEIVQWGVSPEDNITAPDGHVVYTDTDATGETHFVLDGVITPYTPEQQAVKADRQRRCAWSNTTFTWVSERSSEEEAALKATVARATRTSLLAESDWTQLQNSPLSPEAQTAWAIYRQALRDIPAQPGYPNDIQWPVKPS